jgi:multidrug efflux system membrane fusion protein
MNDPHTCMRPDRTADGGCDAHVVRRATGEPIMGKRGIVATALVVLAATAAAWRFGYTADAAQPAHRPPAAAAAVPVTAASARRQDMPVYLRGIGTVQAFNTVEIKAQVSGALVAVPVREGQEVRKGDTVAEIDPRPFQAALQQATAQRAEDAAQLQSAKLDFQRFQSLAKQQFAPVQQVDDQRATVAKLAAAVQADTAMIDTALINLQFCIIRAPINGRVSLYQTDVGNLIEVATQTGIVSITQDQPIAVVFTLPEAQLPRVQAAMAKGAVPVDVYTSDNRTELATGTLLTPNNAIDTTTGTIQLKATFANRRDRLWPGEFVNARVLVTTIPNAVTVPLPAIQHGPEGLFVYTVGPNDAVQVRAVTVGYQTGTIAVVAKGLQSGETVVVAGQSRLSPGVRVAPNAAGGPAHTPSAAAGS